jgi:cytochrome c oxidase subunit II
VLRLRQHSVVEIHYARVFVRRGSIVQLVGLGVVIGGAATVVALVVPWLPPNASEQRNGIDLVFWFATAIAIAIFALVASVILYSVVKFRARPDDDSDGPPIHGHSGLEIVWTAIPAILVTAISVMSGIVLVQNDRAGTGHLNVNVVARQFAWTFQYPDAGNVSSAQLYLPVHQAVELHLTALDVIHSFWVPEFGQKQDALPGQETKLVITPTKLGTYPVICTELCGLGHALMRTSAVVVAPAAFQTWLQQQQQALKAPPGQAGRAVFTNNGCGSCHTLAAAGSTGTVGPNLDRLPAYAAQAHQPLDAFVKQSIVAPNAYVQPGYPPNVMPSTFSSLPPDQLNALVQYLVQSSKGAK